jgi:hypothetical protein
LKMNAPEIGQPLLIPHQTYAMLTEIVTVIGAKKDKAEGDIYISEAMAELGYSAVNAEKVQTKLLKLTGRTQILDHKAMSEKYQALLASSGLLKHFTSQLKELNPSE